jgi:predicted ribosomally synthesized peptide with nif11-like leader
VWLCEDVLREADCGCWGWAMMGASAPHSSQAMSEEQLTALLAKIKDDVGLQEKLKGAADLDAAIALAKEAGFDVSKAVWLKYVQAKQTIELSDEELDDVAGGLPKSGTYWETCFCC